MEEMENMGWCADLVSNKEITIIEVDNIVKELPKYLVIDFFWRCSSF